MTRLYYLLRLKDYFSTHKQLLILPILVATCIYPFCLSAQQNWVEAYAGTGTQDDCDGVTGGADWGFNAALHPQRAAGPPNYNDASSSDAFVGTFGYSSGPIANAGGSTSSPVTYKCLMLDDYNLGVPADAVITGVIVYLSKLTSSGIPAFNEDYEVKLMLPDGSFSENRAPVESVDAPQGTLEWNGIQNYNGGLRDTAFTEAIGAEYDLWGLSNLTPTIVNDPDFGAVIKLVSYGAQSIVDALKIKVFYRQTGNLASNTSGVVFEDLNSDGALTEKSESGIAGIVVNAYIDGSPGDTPVTTATTNQHGFYSLDLAGAGVAAGTDIRLEFNGLPANRFEGFSGEDNHSNVIFTTAGNHAADFSVYAPHEYDYEANNVPLFSSCFVPGEYNGASMDSSAVISVQYEAGGTYLGGGDGPPNTATGINSAGLERSDWGNPTPVKLATHNEVGTVYGLSADRTRNRLYYSSFLKHKTGFGPNGPGAIYAQDVDLTTGTATSSPTLLIDLATDPGAVAMGITVAADSHDPAGDLTAAGATEAASVGVGKESFGDLEISDDDSKLYTVNLTDRKVVEIDLITTSVSKIWDFESGFSFPCGSGSDFRPFGLSYNNGLLYIGAVCTAESTQPSPDASQLHAYVYSIDPSCTGSSCFNLVVDFPMNYRTDDWDWHPWVGDWDHWPDRSEFDTHYQPILSDIEFVDDDMVVAFMNRGAEMWGITVPAPFYPGNTAPSIWAAGDLLRLAWNDVSNSYEMEEFGSAGHRTATYSGSGDFLSGAEFYGADVGRLSSGHLEGTYGGIIQIGGRDLVFGQQNATEIYNNLAQHGGIGWANNHNGQKSKGYFLLQFFGKSNGLGDFEAGFFNPPIMIGNRVWYDADEDGIQDPGETPIAGVTVELLAGGAVIGTATTDTDGHYFFGGPTDANLSGVSLNPSTTYQIRVALTDAQAVIGTILGVTDSDIGTDLHDNDANFDGTYAIVPVTTSARYGDNNYNYDIGFRDTPTPVCDLTDTGKTLETCNNNGTGTDSVDDYITFSLNPTGTTLGSTYTVTVDNGATVTLASGGAASGVSYGSATAFRLQNGSANGTTFTVTVTDDSSTFCEATTTVNQAHCSNDCLISSIDETLETCNDNGTSSDPSDDYITFSLNPTGLNLGASYAVTADNGATVTLAAGGTATGVNYGAATAFRLQNGSADGTTNYTVTVTDVDDAACQAATMVMQSSCSPNCLISDVAKTAETCNDNGTGSDVSDDYITFSLNPTGFNLGATYAITVNNGATVSLAAGGAATAVSYGTNTAFRLQNGSANGTTYTITITDAGDGSCQATSTLMQNSCSPDCLINDVAESLEACNDNGTRVDASDDYISFSLNPTGLNLGATYAVSADNGGVVTLAAGGTATSVSYGTTTAFRLQNGSANGTTYTITITDAGDSSCQATTTVVQSDCAASLFSLGNRVFYDDDINGIQNGSEAGVDGVQLQLLNADGSVYDSDDTTLGIQALTVMTANGGYYRFDDLPIGNYIVEVSAAALTTGGILETYSSSNGFAQEADPNNNGDLNDNGLDTPVAGAVRSGVISLGDTEPTGESEPSSYAAGSFTGTPAADTESNLTVDFGFYRQRDRPDCCEEEENPCTEEPCHFISNDIYFGNGVTNDPNSNTNAGADTDTDDGLLWGENLNLSPGGTLNLPVSIYNNTGSDAYLRIWIDWNDDGDYDDAGEQVADETYLVAIYSGSFTVHHPVIIPTNAVQNQNLALRMRLSTDDADSSGPCGGSDCADDGEIEDYLLRVSCPTKKCILPGVTLTRRN